VVLREYFVLLVYSLALDLPFIHVREFQGEEAKRVIIAREMLESGDFAVPRSGGSVYLKKPPLFNWVLAGLFRRKVPLLVLLVLAIKLFWASFYFPYHSKNHSHYRDAARAINSLIPAGVPIYDMGAEKDPLVFYLERDVRPINQRDVLNLENGCIVYMRKKDAEKVRLKGFETIFELNVRRTPIVFLRRSY